MGWQAKDITNPIEETEGRLKVFSCPFLWLVPQVEFSVVVVGQVVLSHVVAQPEEQDADNQQCNQAQNVVVPEPSFTASKGVPSDEVGAEHNRIKQEQVSHSVLPSL